MIMPLWNWGKDDKNVSIQQNRIQHSKVPYKNKQLKKKILLSVSAVTVVSRKGLLPWYN